MLSPIGISVSMCLAMHMYCLLWPMRRLRRQPGTHTLCVPVCDNLLFSLLHCSLLSPSISSSSTPIIPSCVLSAGPYQPGHYRLCCAQFACKFRFRDWFYIWSFKDFSGRYFIHFGWPTASSRPTFWSPSLPPRLQTSVSFYWFWRLAASVCTDKEQKCVCVCVCCIPTAHTCNSKKACKSGKKKKVYYFDLVFWDFITAQSVSECVSVCVCVRLYIMLSGSVCACGFVSGSRLAFNNLWKIIIHLKSSEEQSKTQPASSRSQPSAWRRSAA